MEFLDEEPRQRFFVQSRSTPSSSSQTSTSIHQLNKSLILFCFSLSASLIALCFFFFQSQTMQFLLIWSAASLLLAPFAPSAVTGGNICVGQGPIVYFANSDGKSEPGEDPSSKPSNRRSKPRRSDDSRYGNCYAVGTTNGSVIEEKMSVSSESTNENVVKSSSENKQEVKEEREWNDEDVEFLKKQMLKHPVGKARRWEIIGEAFGGRHSVESVIKKAKALAEKKAGSGDSYAEFLRNRKPLDKRIEGAVEEGNLGLVESGESREEVVGGTSWSSSEDIALLNALKVFPKDVSMRWEKIAASVPGRSKTACMKRIAELKKDFRSSKLSAEP